jgi:transposase-like protein
MAATAEKRVNYTEELTAAIVQRYQSGEPVEAIAESIGKAVRSVRSKLVREGVYVASEKPKAVKVEGPSKKELINELESLVDFPVDGLMNATKEAIAHVIALAQAVKTD